MKPETEITIHSWEREVTRINTTSPASPVGGEGAGDQTPLPRPLQERADFGLHTRRVVMLIALFVIIVAIEGVLLAHVPKFSTLRVYQAPEDRHLVKG